MSTIKSSNEDITINADGSGRSVKFQANGVEKASIDSSGNFTSTSIDATKLSGALPAIDGSALTGVSQTTSVVNTAGQNWAGVAYTDPDAVGANPTAKIYPDGTVVGSTANGNYTKYPNGDLVCSGYYSGNITVINTEQGGFIQVYPMAFNTMPLVKADASKSVITSIPGGPWVGIDGSGTGGTTSTTQVSSYFKHYSVGPFTISYLAIGRWKA